MKIKVANRLLLLLVLLEVICVSVKKIGPIDLNSFSLAIIISAILFGIFHMNIQQFIYAFF